MEVRHYDIEAPQSDREGLKQLWSGYYVLPICKVVEGGKAEFYRDILISLLKNMGRKSINIVEVGAGWGRVCLDIAGLIDFKLVDGLPVSYNCLGVEGDSVHYKLLFNNLKQIHGGTVHGVVSDKDSVVYFTKAHCPEKEYGQAIVSLWGRLFYREVVKVKSYTLDTLCRDFQPDFIHMDIQGAEVKVLKKAKLDGVKYLWVNTHRAKYHKILKKLLSGFELVFEMMPKTYFRDGIQIYKARGI